MVNKGSCSKLEQNKYAPISPQDWITFCIPVFFVSSKPVTDELLFCTSPGKLKGDGCICFFKPFCALIKSSCSGSEMVRSFPKKINGFSVLFQLHPIWTGVWQGMIQFRGFFPEVLSFGFYKMP